MEAMAAVTGALLNVYDMLKPLDENISFSDVKLVGEFKQTSSKFHRILGFASLA
jgi:molybdenum cofactor biosynthesis enzyme